MKKHASFFLLVATVLAPLAGAEPYTCSGRIVDAKAQPVSGADVATCEQFYDSFIREYRARLLGPIKKTDSNGRFAFNIDIGPRSDVFIVARKEGLALGWDCLTYNHRNKGSSDVSIVLEPPCVLAGRVVDDTGKAIAGAKVHAVPKTSYLSRLRPTLGPKQWLTIDTDAEGHFRFDSFAADTSADFWVQTPLQTLVYKYTPCYISNCGFYAGQTDVQLVLPPEVPIEGRVVEAESNNAVAGIDLLIQPEDIKRYAYPYVPVQVTSGADGAFRFVGLPPGKHRLRVILPENEIAEWVGKRVTLDVQTGRPLANIVVRVDKGGLLDVSVCDGATKRPLRDVRVSVYSDDVTAASRTGADGKARLRLPAGEYQIYATAEGYSYCRDDKTAANGETVRTDILLDRKPCVSGTVRDETGWPLIGAAVRVHPFGDEVCTDANGKFEAGFPQRPGERILVVRHAERNLAAAVGLKNKPKPIDVKLAPAVLVTGRVTDTNGAGIAAARIALIVHISNCLSPLGAEVLADAQGRYAIPAVPPAQGAFNYRVCVNAAGYGVAKYKRVTIAGEPGTTVELEAIALPPADQSVSGVVLDPQGKPAAAVPVFLQGKGNPSERTQRMPRAGLLSQEYAKARCGSRQVLTAVPAGLDSSPRRVAIRTSRSSSASAVLMSPTLPWSAGNSPVLPISRSSSIPTKQETR